jgi:predicted esterase
MTKKIPKNAYAIPAEEIKRLIADRQSLHRRELEDYLRQETFRYPDRQKELWDREYSSIEKYLASVEPNRQRWQDALGRVAEVKLEAEPKLDPWHEDEHCTAWQVILQTLPGLHARGILAIPKSKKPVPLVIAQHGIGSSPERVFGLDDPGNIYHAYGRRLVEEGFAVIAPLHITDAAPRARYERMAKMLGITLWGLEIFKLRKMLDYLETRKEIDIKHTGMYGISLGGAYTLFTTPLESRIKAAVICAWFNHRLNKMVIDDPRYSCFLSTNEEHIFIPGWLREFTDSDLVSLICPRPVLIETGKADGIAWWPQVMEEFKAATQHYISLGIGERIEMDLHEGGHEIRLVRSLEFLKKWLM